MYTRTHTMYNKLIFIDFLGLEMYLNINRKWRKCFLYISFRENQL